MLASFVCSIGTLVVFLIVYDLPTTLELSGTCSVHGTLKRHVSSGIDTTMEEDIFDDYSGSLTGEVKTNGGLAFPFQTADMMLKGGKIRSRAGSLSSPTHLPPPRLGVSGLYTDHLERRKYTMDPPGLSPPVRYQSESSLFTPLKLTNTFLDDFIQLRCPPLVLSYLENIILLLEN